MSLFMLKYHQVLSMESEDRFKYLVGGYFGVKSMDEYQSKLFILKDIEHYIIKYVELSDPELNYREIAEAVKKNVSLKEKLQDSLILLNEMKGPIELILLIKAKIKEIKYNESHK